MNKKILPVTAIIIALSLLIFVGKPHLRRRNALNAVRTVLTHWENNDIPSAMAYWKKEQDSPPVNGLLNYEIRKREFSRKRGIYTAHISALLHFPKGTQLPSGREWVFELNKTRRGWKIIDFRLKT